MKESIHGGGTFLFQVLCREIRTLRDTPLAVRCNLRRLVPLAIPRELSHKSVRKGNVPDFRWPARSASKGVQDSLAGAAGW